MLANRLKANAASWPLSLLNKRFCLSKAQISYLNVGLIKDKGLSRDNPLRKFEFELILIFGGITGEQSAFMQLMPML